MGYNDGPGDGQAETGTVRLLVGTRFVGTIEAVEEVREVLWFDGLPLIDDGNL